MTPLNFTMWLQGFVEMNGAKMPTPEQWKMITEHLSSVFNKVTPPLSTPPFPIPIIPINPWDGYRTPDTIPWDSQPTIIC